MDYLANYDEMAPKYKKLGMLIPKKEMIKNFSKLEKTKKEIGTGGIICFYDTLTKLDENNYIIPVSNVINYSEP